MSFCDYLFDEGLLLPYETSYCDEYLILKYWDKYGEDYINYCIKEGIPYEDYLEE